MCVFCNSALLSMPQLAPFALRIRGRTALVTRMVPHRLTSDTCLYVSTVVNSTSPNMETPALFTTAHRPAGGAQQHNRTRPSQTSAHFITDECTLTVPDEILKPAHTKLIRENKELKHYLHTNVNNYS